MSKYDDIINLKRPVSKKHSPMSIENRAAQFAPFSALTGYNEAVKETARITDSKRVLTEGVLEIINDKLNYIKNNIFTIGLVKVKYFQKDKKKSGGAYLEKSGYVKKIDVNSENLYFKDGVSIKFDDILEIEFHE